MRYLKMFENFNNGRVDISGLKCDNTNCDFEDDTPLEDYKKSIGKPCPKCGDNLLTQEDYDKTMEIIDSMEILNMYSQEDLSKIVNNLSNDEMDKVLDVMNILNIRKTGETEDGQEIWTGDL